MQVSERNSLKTLIEISNQKKKVFKSLTSRKMSKIKMVLHKTLDQSLTTVQVSKESLQGLRRYGSLKIFTKTSNFDAYADAKMDANARVTKIAVLEHSLR